MTSVEGGSGTTGRDRRHGRQTGTVSIPPLDALGTDDAAVFTAAVDTVLSAFLQERRRDLAAMHPELAAGVDRISAFLAGGKRIRPIFCWWGWRAGGGRNAVVDCGPVVQVAASLELLQACALMHDDLIDRSETRRGRPSVHRAEAQHHTTAGWSGDADHFGVSAALLLGDLALVWADDLFVTAAARLGALDRAQPDWQRMRTEVLAGQLLDLRASVDPTADPVEQARAAQTVIRLKTAGYTVIGPLLLGAALAGAGADTRDRLERYGEAIGTAFQLRDDLLGVFGDPADTGKPAGDDLREGKRTLLLAEARADLAGWGRPEDLADLEALDAGVGVMNDPDDVQRLRDILSSTAAPARIETRIDELVAQAMDVVTPLGAEAVEGLRGLADRATRRTF